jgi:membrane protease YdiL (CAAX protease family)
MVLAATTRTAWRLAVVSGTTWRSLASFSLIAVGLELLLRLVLTAARGDLTSWVPFFNTLRLPPIYVFRGLVGSPVGEELLFRGWLLGFLAVRMPGVSRIGRVTLSYANILTSLAFALGHIANGVTAVCTAYICSLVLGAAQEQSKSLLVPIWCHFLINLM